MNWEVDILDTTQLRFEGDFDAQVQEILSFVRLTADKVHSLKLLFDDVEQTLQRLVPGCVIHPFGSVVTGLGIRTSDIDCYVALPNGEEATTEHIIRTRNLLQRNHRKFTQTFAITTAKVPIVKFVHIPTNFQCDINFKSPAGVQNSKLMAFLLHYDRRALPLAILIKYWSKIHKFTGTNLMGNYTLIIMVIFYLQLMSILPSVYELQRHMDSYMIDNWNAAFDDSMRSNTTNNDTLYDLMGGFFKCYSMFNFKENVISPFMGRVVNKKCFEHLDSLPEEFLLYKDHISNNVCKKLVTTSMMCIQDPFEHNKNCAAGVFKRLAGRIISHFQFASKKFDVDRDNNFLRAILTHDPNSMQPSKVLTNQKHCSNSKIKKPIHKQRKQGLQNGFHKWFTQMNSMSKGKR